MAKKVIKLSQDKLQTIVSESVRRIVTESLDNGIESLTDEDKVDAIRFNWNISVTPEGAKKMYELYEKLLRSKFVLDFEADSERISLSQTSVIR